MTTKKQPPAQSKSQSTAPASPPPIRAQHADSRPNRIALLDIGESESMAQRIPMRDATAERITASTTAVKGNMSKAAERACERTGNTYTTETVTSLTRSNDVLVITVVTRTS